MACAAAFHCPRPLWSSGGPVVLPSTVAGPTTCRAVANTKADHCATTAEKLAVAAPTNSSACKVPPLMHQAPCLANEHLCHTSRAPAHFSASVIPVLCRLVRTDRPTAAVPLTSCMEDLQPTQGKLEAASSGGEIVFRQKKKKKSKPFNGAAKTKPTMMMMLSDFPFVKGWCCTASLVVMPL